MRWKAMQKRASAGSADFYLLRILRRWPLSYFLAILMFLLLLPQFCYKASLRTQKIKEVKSIFGDNLYPTPWHWHDNQLGPENRTWERGLAILKCSYPHWYHSSPKRTVIRRDKRECPSYFHWIRKDLAPWNTTGITPINIEMAKEHAAFKVVILKGRLYVELYYSCVQTRAVFTVWGLLMLLEKYKGKIPDVEMLFDCMDRPHIQKSADWPSELWSPAPLFRYCSNSKHYDIPWPDWSFWGWSETNLDPWDEERDKIKNGAEKIPWRLKESKAYWRGNPDVGSPLRMELMQCNAATKYPQTEIYNQNWTTELALGKQNSKLENQCQHRYKIYAEGFAWSVSFKYIMACGSATLAISPAYYDFYMRGLEPGVHYIPVRPTEICAPQLCGAIAEAVTNGERNIYEAVEVGEAGQQFVSNDIGMYNVYDYMFHMLKAYAGLQRFKPSVPRKAKRVTQEFILCMAEPHERLLLEKSRDQIPWTTAPCQLPPEDEFKDFAWEAPEHDDGTWAETNCAFRKGKGKNKGKGKGKGRGKGKGKGKEKGESKNKPKEQSTSN